MPDATQYVLRLAFGCDLYVIPTERWDEFDAYWDLVHECKRDGEEWKIPERPAWMDPVDGPIQAVHFTGYTIKAVPSS
jgi:hypothetical protein